MSAIVTGSSVGNQGVLGPGPRRHRSAWHMQVTKTEGVAKVTLMYKNTKGRIAPYSKSTSNATVKYSWGTPINCEYQATKSDLDTIGQFKFTSKKNDTVLFKEKDLNSFEGGTTNFSKRVAALVVDSKQSLLAKYLSLMVHCKGFIHHREGIHSDEGFLVDVQGQEEILVELGGSLEDFSEFVKFALDSAKDIQRVSVAGQDITNFFGPEVGKENSSAKKSKKTKSERINDLEDAELKDAQGLEKEYQSSFVGIANIPLKNLNISRDLDVKINPFRVQHIIKSMKQKYDPSLSVAVVCPEVGQTVSDLQNLGQLQQFVVVQKIHTIAAFKELDKNNDFCKLTSHQNGTVLCFVLSTNSAGMIQYGNIRANEIQNQFLKKTRPQDFLRVYQSLSERKNPSSSMKATERMIRLLRVGPNESCAIRKLCGWSLIPFAKLMIVISKFERYETLDVDEFTCRGFQQKLAHGDRNYMPNYMFRELGKMDENYFLTVHEKILNNECSLKHFLEEYSMNQQINKVSDVLSILSGYKEYESLVNAYPGRFEHDNIKKYIGADIKNGTKNRQALDLQSYYKFVMEGSEKDFVKDTNFEKYEDFDQLMEEKKYFHDVDMVVLKMVDDNKDIALSLVNHSLRSEKSKWARLIMLPGEAQQFEILTYLRDQNEECVKSIPLMFHQNSVLSGDIHENVCFAVLFGRFSELLPPINRYQCSVDGISSIIPSIFPSPVASVVVIADPKATIVQVSSEDVIALTYHGTEDVIDKLKTVLKKVSNTQFCIKASPSIHNAEPLNVDVNSNVDDAVPTSSPFKTPQRKVVIRDGGYTSSSSGNFLDRLENIAAENGIV